MSDVSLPTRECRACGDAYQPKRADAVFCSTVCRKAWNNLRAQRGAEFYDLIMALRHERGLAKQLNLWSAICRLAASYYQRDSRVKSWNDPRRILEAKPYLKTSSTEGRI